MPIENRAGGCHCGAVRYEAAVDLGHVVSCNCSHCAAKGLLLSFVPVEQFRLVQGEDGLREYQFNKHVIHHLFCGACGVQSFARGRRPDGKEMVAINVRCLDGIDIGVLKLTPYDGRSL